MLVELMIKINADNEVVDISEQAEMLPDRLLDRLIAYFHPRRDFNITFSMSRGRFHRAPDGDYYETDFDNMSDDFKLLDKEPNLQNDLIEYFIN